MKNTPWGSSFKPPPEVLHGGSPHQAVQCGLQLGATCRVPVRWALAHACRPRLDLALTGGQSAGYDRKVNGDTAEERLDLRCAMKTDKFCK